jgi:diguanylate cyclase (GGDEF)-like protein
MATIGAPGVTALAAIAVLLIAGLWGLRRARAQAERQRELHELLSVSASRAESSKLLIAYMERIVPGGAAVLLNRHETDDRLALVPAAAPTTGPLRGVQMEHLRSRSCMAVRLSRAYERRTGVSPVLECEVCGGLPGAVACEPLRVGGQVIGSVLVAREKPISGGARAQLREAVAQTAPILANQRNLELAESRAASDLLTGLPNRRAAEETLRRMAAHAGRSLSPLAVLLLDLDRFTRVNDRHGQDQGDRALTTIGQVLAASIRASDFAARCEGEEFLVLLPDTDRRGAVEVAERIRRAFEQAEMPVIGSLTASFGVAALPEDAVAPEQLIRQAARALHLAKARGRNRIEVAHASSAGEPRGDGGKLPGGSEGGGREG